MAGKKEETMKEITLNLTEAELDILKGAIANFAAKTDSPTVEEALDNIFKQLEEA